MKKCSCCSIIFEKKMLTSTSNPTYNHCNYVENKAKDNTCINNVRGVYEIAEGITKKCTQKLCQFNLENWLRNNF